MLIAFSSIAPEPRHTLSHLQSTMSGAFVNFFSPSVSGCHHSDGPQEMPGCSQPTRSHSTLGLQKQQYCSPLQGGKQHRQGEGSPCHTSVHLSVIAVTCMTVRCAKHRLFMAPAKRRDPILSPFIQLGERPEVYSRASLLLHALYSKLQVDHVFVLTQEGTDMMGYLLRNRVLFVGSRINDEVRLLLASMLAVACIIAQ